MTYQQCQLIINDCSEAREWVGERTFEESWRECERADWMCCLLQRSGIDRKTVVRIAAEIANTLRSMMTDQRSIHAVDTAIKYGRGEATEEELSAARAAGWAAAIDRRDAAADAAFRAADGAADGAVRAAFRAANRAAWAVGDGAARAAAEDAGYDAHRKNAQIVRQFMPNPLFIS
jgi:hypothetical protein